MRKALSWIVLAVTVGFLLSPFFTENFAGFDASRFPVPQIDPPVQPIGWAFAIWSVIYPWLLISAVWGVWKADTTPDWQAMRPALAVSLGIGMFWLPVANQAPVTAAVMIVVMAMAAVVAMCRAGDDRPWLLSLPIGLYAGWLTAATGVAIGVNLGGYGFLSGRAAALLCLALVLIAALVVQAPRRRVWTYPLAVGWGLIGVIAQNWPARDWTIIGLCALGIVLLAVQALRR